MRKCNRGADSAAFGTSTGQPPPGPAPWMPAEPRAPRRFRVAPCTGMQHVCVLRRAVGAATLHRATGRLLPCSTDVSSREAQRNRHRADLGPSCVECGVSRAPAPSPPPGSVGAPHPDELWGKQRAAGPSAVTFISNATGQTKHPTLSLRRRKGPPAGARALCGAAGTLLGAWTGGRQPLPHSAHLEMQKKKKKQTDFRRQQSGAA